MPIDNLFRMKPQLLKIVHNYLRVIEENQPFEALRAFYHPHATQIEYPNLLTKATAHRNVEAIAEGYEKGKKVLQKQTYEVIKSYEVGNAVIIECIWRGQLAIPIGSKAVGEEMKAHFAQFFEFEDEKILSQRNYDCFESF